jgi:TatA/E family protein of Tat protein translocase
VQAQASPPDTRLAVLSPRAWSQLLVSVVGLLLFAAKRLPEIGRSLGSGIDAFKRALTSPNEGAPEEDR